MNSETGSRLLRAGIPSPPAYKVNIETRCGSGTEQTAGQRAGMEITFHRRRGTKAYFGGEGGKEGRKGAADVTDSNKSSPAIAVLLKDTYGLSFAVFVLESIKLHL